MIVSAAIKNVLSKEDNSKKKKKKNERKKPQKKKIHKLNLQVTNRYDGIVPRPVINNFMTLSQPTLKHVEYLIKLTGRRFPLCEIHVRMSKVQDIEEIPIKLSKLNWRER